MEINEKKNSHVIISKHEDVSGGEYYNVIEIYCFTGVDRLWQYLLPKDYYRAIEKLSSDAYNY